jgi:hypothetical protein
MNWSVTYQSTGAVLACGILYYTVNAQGHSGALTSTHRTHHAGPLDKTRSQTPLRPLSTGCPWQLTSLGVVFEGPLRATEVSSFIYKYVWPTLPFPSPFSTFFCPPELTSPSQAPRLPVTRCVVFGSSLSCSVESESHDRALRLAKPFELCNPLVFVARSRLHLVTVSQLTHKHSTSTRNQVIWSAGSSRSGAE